MKKSYFLFVFTLYCCFMGSKVTAQTETLRHVVSFKFKTGTSDDQINALVRDFKGLRTKIPQIQSFEWGTNNSPEGLEKGMTHCFILTFKNEADRDIYLPHPAHKAFGKKHSPIIEDVFVIDFFAER